MNWYICKCGNIFDETNAAENEDVETSEAWGQRTITTTFTVACPDCRSEDLRDHAKCETPDCMNEILDGLDECATCFEDSDPSEFRDYMLRWHGVTDGEPCNPREMR